MRTKGEKIMQQFLLTVKLGMLALGMFAILCVPRIVLTADAQAHSNHLHAYSNAIGFLAENENKVSKDATYVTKDVENNPVIVLASDEKNELPCPQKTDTDDNK